MAAHHYHLRSRPHTPTPSPTLPGEFATKSTLDADRTRHRSRSDASDSASGVRPGLSYSQAVAPRTPSEPRAPEATFVSKQIKFSSTHVPGVPQRTMSESGRRTNKSLSSTTIEDDGGPWTTVRHNRRSKSLSAHSEASPLLNLKQELISVLTTDQVHVVKAAEEAMTPADRDRVQQRMRTMRSSCRRERESSVPQEAGPSKRNTGKTVDPRNWGNVGIEHSELNPEAQRRELAAYSGQPYVSPEVQELLGDMTVNEQREALTFWNSRKVALNSEQGGPAGRNLDNRSVAVSPSKTDAGGLDIESPARVVDGQVSTAPPSNSGRLQQEVDRLRAKITALEGGSAL
ncbi:hypothetical protein B0H21DRAFT_703288 [Amylocystis lapponica]|nr:hypothetical protein B0H21DRAFT_703288 [Amylocystis lapponica]